MKILIFLGNDAANLSIEGTVRKLHERHQLRVFADNMNQQAIGMFDDIMDLIKPSQDCVQEDIDWADCIFCSVLSMRKVQSMKKYIFTFAHMNPNFDEVRGSDFVFTLAENNSPFNKGIPTYFASLPVGIAKNDVPVRTKEKKQILYIDAGHFPFGGTGHRQLAEMLLGICKKFPDYNICIKPRWQPEATAAEMSNVNFSHIFTALEELSPQGLPENLELLREYRNMQELVDESVCIISSCTSAYLDAALRGKNLLLVKGIENEDMYHLRADYFEQLYAFAEGSGCVVDYREVEKYLPEGKPCSPEHLKQAFSYNTGASGRIVEVMEYIYERYLSRGLYPAIKDYHYETFRDELEADRNLTMVDLLTNRYFCATETCVVLTYKISTTLDWTDYYKEQMRLCRDAAELCVKQNDFLMCRETVKQLQKDVTAVKRSYLVKHAEFARNSVDLSYLYDAMYEQKRYDQIMELFWTSEKPHEALFYYAGRLYWRLKERKAAQQCLLEFLKESFSRTYPKYYQDNKSFRNYAFSVLIRIFYAQKDIAGLLQLIDLLREYTRCYPQKGRIFKPSLARKVEKLLLQEGYEEQAEAVKELEKCEEQEKWNKIFKMYHWAGDHTLGAIRIIAGLGLGKIKGINNWSIKIIKRVINKIKKEAGRGREYFTHGTSFDRAQREKILAMQDRYSQGSCFIVENSDAISQADIELMKSKGWITFAGEDIYKIFEKTDWRPDYYGCMDFQLFQENIAEILLKIRCPLLLNMEAKEKVRLFGKMFEKELENICFVKYSQRNNIRFLPQITKINFGGDDTFTLLEWAWMMGFRKFYIFQKESRDSRNLKKEKLDRKNMGYEVAREYITAHGGTLYEMKDGECQIIE